MKAENFDEIDRIFATTPAPFPTREAAKTFFESTYGSTSPMGRFLLSNVRESTSGLHDWRFSAVAMRKLLKEAATRPLWEEWRNFEGPIEMILGGSSTFVSSELLLRCQSERPGRAVNIHQVPQAGHWVHADQPQGFFDCLIRVLKNLN